MNHFIEGILKIAILEAACAVIVIDRLLAASPGPRFERGRKAAFLSVAFLAIFTWSHFGALRGNGGVVHIWEQYHFYMGAKYQKEVGWFDLYKATLLVDRESAGVLRGVTQTRDLHTFELVSVDEALKDAPRIRGAFSLERWAEFKSDWLKLAAMPVNWAPIMADHGNSESPAWAILAHPFASVVPLSPGGLSFLAMLDVALMLGLAVFSFKTFGVRLTCIGLIIAASLPNVFDYTFGSFLRWDWLFALGMAMCFMKREKWATAGAFFGFAVATKLFPVFFGVGLLLHAAWVTMSERKVARRYLRFGAGALGSGVAAVLLGALMCGSFGAWVQYKDRIQVAMVEKYYPIQYSLKTVYIQVAASGLSEFLDHWAAPAEIQQGRREVVLSDYAAGLFLAQVLFTLLVAAAVRRGDDLSAFAMGPFLVFVWLTVNMYYWHMLGLAALGLSLRQERPPLFALFGLHAVLAVFYLYQHTNHGWAEPYIVALLLAVLIAAYGAAEAIVLYRGTDRPWAAPAKPAPAK